MNSGPRGMDCNPKGAERHSLSPSADVVFLVPSAGLEPALPCEKRILSPLRLPIPPRGPGEGKSSRASKRKALGRRNAPDIERLAAAAQLELRQLHHARRHGAESILCTLGIEGRGDGAGQEHFPGTRAAAEAGSYVDGIAHQGGTALAGWSE